MNLYLMQIADSALPISGYTHSWGLETAIAAGQVSDAASLEQWTRDWLRSSVAPFEGVLAAAAHRATAGEDADRLLGLHCQTDAALLPPSLRAASREMGDQLLALGRTWAWSAVGLRHVLPALPRSGDKWHHCIAFGIMGALAAASTEQVLVAYLHQAVLGMISAGVRAIPVGHTHGQQVLAYLQEEIVELLPVVLESDLETAGSGCPYYEMLCHEQTQLYARLFRS